MKRSGTFKWTPEAAAAFEDLKKYLASPPVMVAPWPRRPLELYLAASPHAVSAVLVAERDEPIVSKEKTTSSSQRPPDDTAPSQKPPLEGEGLPQEAPPSVGLERPALEPPEEPAATLTTRLIKHPV